MVLRFGDMLSCITPRDVARFDRNPVIRTQIWRRPSKTIENQFFALENMFLFQSIQGL
jgi:hypothetical protein